MCNNVQTFCTKVEYDNKIKPKRLQFAEARPPPPECALNALRSTSSNYSSICRVFCDRQSTPVLVSHPIPSKSSCWTCIIANHFSQPCNCVSDGVTPVCIRGTYRRSSVRLCETCFDLMVQIAFFSFMYEVLFLHVTSKECAFEEVSSLLHERLHNANKLTEQQLESWKCNNVLFISVKRRETPFPF